jgi:hypothetical protein
LEQYSSRYEGFDGKKGYDLFSSPSGLPRHSSKSWLPSLDNRWNQRKLTLTLYSVLIFIARFIKVVNETISHFGPCNFSTYNLVMKLYFYHFLVPENGGRREKTLDWPYSTTKNSNLNVTLFIIKKKFNKDSLSF